MECRLDTAGVEQTGDVVDITGQHRVTRVDKEGEVTIHDVARCASLQQFPDSPAGALVERGDVDSGESSGQVHLPGTAAPRLRHDGGAGADRDALALRDS